MARNNTITQAWKNNAFGIQYILLAVGAFIGYNLIKGFIFGAKDLGADAQAAGAGLSAQERQLYKAAAKKVGKELGTDTSLPFWSTWFANQQAAYDLLLPFVGNLNRFNIYYKPLTGGVTIQSDIQRLYKGFIWGPMGEKLLSGNEKSLSVYNVQTNLETNAANQLTVKNVVVQNEA